MNKFVVATQESVLFYVTVTRFQQKLTDEGGGEPILGFWPPFV